jgi:hypothetical protein
VIFEIVCQEYILMEHMNRLPGGMNFKAAGRELMGRFGWVNQLKDHHKLLAVMAALGRGLFEGQDVGKVLSPKPWEMNGHARQS